MTWKVGSTASFVVAVGVGLIGYVNDSQWGITTMVTCVAMSIGWVVAEVSDQYRKQRSSTSNGTCGGGGGVRQTASAHTESGSVVTAIGLPVFAIAFALSCLLLTQFGLRFPETGDPLRLRSFFFASDIAALFPLIHLDNSSRWRVFLEVSFARLAVTIPIVVWLRSTTTGFGDGLFLLGYGPASLFLCAFAAASVAFVLVVTDAKALKVAARRQVV